MKAKSGKDRGLKLIGCVCFLLIAVALLLIDRYSPATGYELSVYDSLPPMVWICLIAALAGGTGIVVHQALRACKSRYWHLGFLVLIFGTLIILLLPIIRGYYLYASGDTHNHFWWAAEIVADGHFWRGDQYPIIHILVAQLVQVTGAPATLMMEFVPVLYTVLFMLFSYLLASSVMARKEQALLAAATTPLFFNYYHVAAYPHALAVMALPAVFFLYFRALGTRSPSLRVAFVVVLLVFPYSHPAPAMVLIACLLATEAAKAAWRARSALSSSLASTMVDRITLEPTFISSVAFLTWISTHRIFGTTIRGALAWLGREIEEIPRVAEVETMLESRGLEFATQVEVALRMYGDSLAYVGLSAVALLIIAWGFLRRRDEVKNLVLLAVPFLVSGPVWILVFGTTLQVTVGRLLGANIMMWATPVLVAFVLYWMFGRWKRAGLIIVSSILVGVSTVALFGVYHSPHILQPSWQVTDQDVKGAGWFRGYVDPEIGRTYGHLGVASLFAGKIAIPSHFAYAWTARLGDAWNIDMFLVLGDIQRQAIAHPVLSEGMISSHRLARPEFDEADFGQLEEDPTVNKLYSNGQLEVVLTKG